RRCREGAGRSGGPGASRRGAGRSGPRPAPRPAPPPGGAPPPGRPRRSAAANRGTGTGLPPSAGRAEGTGSRPAAGGTGPAGTRPKVVRLFHPESVQDVRPVGEQVLRLTPSLVPVKQGPCGAASGEEGQDL